MRTLYTGHITIGRRTVHSFIYAETLYEAEEQLADILQRYIRDRYRLAASLVLPRINVVSRPYGWNLPGGPFLPGTSSQYFQRYPAQPRPDGLVYESETASTP
ncbi:MAG: hypothetical protein IRZ31_03880 [Thermogemmatispora sp.]|uniref:hypothetical protein n=1 Tax=Thermogemmatispora sp. TaxID=1968838 RepID=UPI002611E37F|nr:hypothetical protein [Thermogemmatispora sp.]MBX5456016.1 hypothetical protein [Thermogemmatispora sp.]